MADNALVGNVGLVREFLGLREYITYLRVERGLRPLSCEAYRRDLQMFAEFLEKADRTLLSARQEDVSAFMQDLREHALPLYRHADHGHGQPL